MNSGLRGSARYIKLFQARCICMVLKIAKRTLKPWSYRLTVRTTGVNTN